MRALVVLGGLGAILGARVAVTAADQRTGFDHIVHEGRVSVLGGAAIACASCHAMTASGTLTGRPDHRACFGACHGPSPRRGEPVDEPRAAVCAACHAPSQLAAKRPTVSYPPYQLDADYGLTLDHARHATPACTTCHATPRTGGPAPAARATAPHARCASCHAVAQVAPLMTACSACHPAAYGANARPRLAPGELAVGDAYDHQRHRGRAPAAEALRCSTCHVAIATATGVALPTPAMSTCTSAGCHDGAAAFASVGDCARCHTRAPTEAFEVARPDLRFSHAGHAARTPLPACAGCHSLDRNGEAQPPSHAACASCHAADFGARAPTICGACHQSTEPWRHLRADQRPPARSEYGATLSHRAHQATPCASCHRLDTAARELRPPRGHAACTGGCHRASDGPAPQLEACEACHGLGLEARRDAQRSAAAWSVRSQFRHAPHRSADGVAIACARCHAEVASADTVDAIGAPGKPTCAPCHDGVVAFKMTGHGCARCHRP